MESKVTGPFLCQGYVLDGQQCRETTLFVNLTSENDLIRMTHDMEGEPEFKNVSYVFFIGDHRCDVLGIDTGSAIKYNPYTNQCHVVPEDDIKIMINEL